MATRLASRPPGSEPTGVPDASGTIDEDLPQDDLILEFNIIIWVLVSLAGFFFLLRAYCKITRQRGLWWDDHVMGLSWLALIISASFGSVSTTMGFGNHTWNVDTQSPSFSKLLVIMNQTGFWSIFATAWSKTSFAITLLRISEGKIRWLIWSVIISINIILYLGAIFMWVQCNPPAKTYTPWLEGDCWEPIVIIAYNGFAAASSGLADIILAILPWWIIVRSSMNMKERIGMLVCMSLGIFAGLTSIAKTATISATGNSDLIHTVPLNILGIAEAAVTIMAASIPILRALLSSGNTSKSGSSGVIHSPTTGTTQRWRDYEALEALGKDAESSGPVRLATFKQYAESSSQPVGSPHEEPPWARGW